MTIRTRNQKPAVLYGSAFNILPNIAADLDLVAYSDALTDDVRTRYVDPLFIPLNQANPVEIEDNSTTPATPIDQDTIQNAIMHLWSNPVMDVTLQDQMNAVYNQALHYSVANDWFFEEQLGVEALTRLKLPLPSNSGGRIVRYSAKVDIIPAAKNLLANANDQEAMNWFANLVGYLHDRANNFMLITVQNDAAWDAFKTFLKARIQLTQTNHTIDKDVLQQLNQFDTISLKNDLSAGIFLPQGGLNPSKGSLSELESLSFSRILTSALAQFEKVSGSTTQLTVQPINLAQVYMPENIMVLNLENYAHAQASDIKKDWDDFDNALKAKQALNFVSNKKLMTSKAMNRSMGGGASSSYSNHSGVGRAKVRPFTGKPVPAKHLMKMMGAIIQSQVTNQVTHNTYKVDKSSYMRANRRRPDDINAPGKLSTVKYRPDIHMYFDTSGSISEKHYRDASMNAIRFAKMIDCNLYVTSFSHYVSQTTLLQTKNRSVEEIYKQFLLIPKVTGGTDYENVWKKIDAINEQNRRNNLSHQINFIVTDFEYHLSADRRFERGQASLENTYYIPISTDPRTWKHLLRYAKSFMKQMSKAGNKGIRSRMLL